MEFATRTIHAAQPSEPGTGALVAPIFQTSTYEQEAPGVNQGFDYSRTNNPDARPARSGARRPRGRGARGGLRVWARGRARRAPGLAQAR